MSIEINPNIPKGLTDQERISMLLGLSNEMYDHLLTLKTHNNIKEIDDIGIINLQHENEQKDKQIKELKNMIGQLEEENRRLKAQNNEINVVAGPMGPFVKTVSEYVQSQVERNKIPHGSVIEKQLGLLKDGKAGKTGDRIRSDIIELTRKAKQKEEISA